MFMLEFTDNKSNNALIYELYSCYPDFVSILIVISVMFVCQSTCDNLLTIESNNSVVLSNSSYPDFVSIHVGIPDMFIYI